MILKSIGKTKLLQYNGHCSECKMYCSECRVCKPECNDHCSVTNAAHQNPKNVLFYATDDTSINKTIEELIHDSGYAPVPVGGLEQSIRIEVFGDLHEYGALGKAVTVGEAKEKLGALVV